MGLIIIIIIIYLKASHYLQFLKQYNRGQIISIR